MNQPAHPTQRPGLWRLFLLRTSAAGVLLVLGLLSYQLWRAEEVMQTQILERARAEVESLTLARRWNANHGLVYAQQGPSTQPNPYLGLPEVRAIDGRVFVPIHPAQMTRELSEYAQAEQRFTFHLSSQRPLNPVNAPDSFEQEGYAAFAQGQREFVRQERQGDRTLFRYMTPLFVETGCLPCHAKQGYRKGDVRGGVSLNFDISPTIAGMGTQRLAFSILGLAVASLFVGLIFILVARLNAGVAQAQARLEVMASHDDLTGLYNRRYFFQRLEEEMTRARRHGHPLGLAMIDLDHFKRVNDLHGHQAGDQALKQISGVIKAACRGHDILARYGGEELTVILPEISRPGLAALGEKLRAAVEATPVDVGLAAPLGLTISLGLVWVGAGELAQVDGDDLLRLADQAMYAAKQAGRNLAIM